MPMYIGPMFTISETEVKANFAKDREEFEACIMSMHALSPEVICGWRTPAGYTNKDLDQQFQGFSLARNTGRNVLKFGIIRGTPDVKPGQTALEVSRFSSFHWGEQEFPAPNREKTLACAGYVRVTNNLWPDHICTRTNKVIYTESDRVGAEYIDIVYMAHLGLAEGDTEAEHYAVQMALKHAQILMTSTLPVKTVKELCTPEGVKAAVLIRLRTTHDDFLADQVRWTK